MDTLIKLFKLLYPFLQEFGLREVNLRQFIANNKTMSYMFLMCFILFLLLIYALEQAHLRMLYNKELQQTQVALRVDVDRCISNSEQIQMLCLSVNDDVKTTDESIEELLGKKNGQRSNEN